MPNRTPTDAFHGGPTLLAQAAIERPQHVCVPEESMHENGGRPSSVRARKGKGMKPGERE